MAITLATLMLAESIYSGRSGTRAPLSDIFLEEVPGKYVNKPVVEGTQKDVMALDSQKPMPEEKDVEFSCQMRTLRDVSSYNGVRDQLRDLTRDYLKEEVELVLQ
ncbi:hypothetical protein B0O99DRAFT_591688 [Bisporella sp. PMI_857]|nr:hypothetical protein B0O99DRAFT_591688 [Bisporella sp. PMI_857]